MKSNKLFKWSRAYWQTILFMGLLGAKQNIAQLDFEWEKNQF